MTKLALVGVGHWGRNIKRTLEEIGGVQVITLDKGDDVRLTSSRLRNVDGVLVATPGSTHAKIALPFIRAGIPTFIEKPMTTSLRDALRLRWAAKRSGAIVMVGHIHLYNPAYLKAKQIAKKAGNIRYLLFEGMNNGPYRDDMSALWDWAPHDVAMALDLLGTLPTSVQAWGVKILRPKTTLHDTACIKLEFPSTPVFITDSWLFPEKRKKLTIVGTKSSIAFDDTVIKKKLTLYRGMGPSVRGNNVIRQQPTVSYPAYNKQLPLKLELQAFLTAIKTGKQPLASIDHGVEVIRIIAAAERSVQLDGKTVRF